MAYTPPVGTVTLTLKRRASPSSGGVTLTLGPETATATVSIQARTAGARALFSVGNAHRFHIAAKTGGARATLSVAYDPNLLSPINCRVDTQWHNALSQPIGIQDHWKPAVYADHIGRARWQEATHAATLAREQWRDAVYLGTITRAVWREAQPLSAAASTGWHDAPRLTTHVNNGWREAADRAQSLLTSWIKTLPRLTPQQTERWQTAQAIGWTIIDRFEQGRLIVIHQIECWRQAAYPDNTLRHGPPLPRRRRYIPPVGVVNLMLCGRLSAPKSTVILALGAPVCAASAWLIVPRRRSYRVLNTASLVRLPDLMPLPCSAMTIETDFESWCWALTATLKTPDAWPLVQPNPLACEVRATINGQSWDFLLDVPSLNRSFNSNRVSLKGRSRSAWLHDPYTPRQNFSQTQARQMQQLAEATLENTGWTLTWALENWVVPAGSWNSVETPIEVLIRLASVTDDGIYTHPTDNIIYLQKRWPVAAWLVDGLIADVDIPDAAIRSLQQTAVYSPPLNGIYVSGTRYGALALVKIAGTDGALQPAAPLVHELLCDGAGVAARQRGINALSAAGPGWALEAETLFAPQASPAFPLVPPGRIVRIAGIKGVSRSCRIAAQWSGDRLHVSQALSLERREN